MPRRAGLPGRPFGEGDGFGPELDDRIAGGRVLRPYVRPAHDPRQALEIQDPVGVPMPDQDGGRGDRLQLVQHDVPVGDRRVDRIVGDENGGLHRRARLGQALAQPADVLGRPVAVAHPQDGPLVHADEPEAAALEGEAVVPPEPPEIRAARIRPFRVVVSGNDVVRDAEAVENVLGFAEIPIETHLGHVARDQDKGEVPLLIDVRDRSPEVGRAAVRADVRVAQPGESQRDGDGRRGHGPEPGAEADRDPGREQSDGQDREEAPPQLRHGAVREIDRGSVSLNRRVPAATCQSPDGVPRLGAAAHPGTAGGNN